MRNYDLLKRTEKFGIDIIKFVRNIKVSLYNYSALKQIIRSGTSIGANYCEATNASSPKDFKNKLHYCKKETEETIYWLTIINHTRSFPTDELIKLKSEANELLKIFQKSITTVKKRLK